MATVTSVPTPIQERSMPRWISWISCLLFAPVAMMPVPGRRPRVASLPQVGSRNSWPAHARNIIFIAALLPVSPMLRAKNTMRSSNRWSFFWKVSTMKWSRPCKRRCKLRQKTWILRRRHAFVTVFRLLNECWRNSASSPPRDRMTRMWSLLPAARMKPALWPFSSAMGNWLGVSFLSCRVHVIAVPVRLWPLSCNSFTKAHLMFPPKYLLRLNLMTVPSSRPGCVRDARAQSRLLHPGAEKNYA